MRNLDLTEVIPPPIQAMLREHSAIFKEPKGLPPQRSFDHSIPLLPGARPVNIRPYRYAPKQKDKIKKTNKGNATTWSHTT